MFGAIEDVGLASGGSGGLSCTLHDLPFGHGSGTGEGNNRGAPYARTRVVHKSLANTDVRASDASSIDCLRQV